MGGSGRLATTPPALSVHSSAEASTLEWWLSPPVKAACEPVEAAENSVRQIDSPMGDGRHALAAGW